MKPEYNLGWGDPLIVRQALVETLGRNFSFADKPLSDMGYPPHLGSPKLIEQLKDLAERHSDHRPKHMIVTCGATGAINAALYAVKTLKTDWVVTERRHYPMYPAIIGMTDMIMIDRNKKQSLIVSGLSEHNFISLTASPSAPEGLVYPFEPTDIWDSAYASKTYGKGGHRPSGFRIMCGSLSKTLGLPGLRLGWVSTDDDGLADSLGKHVIASCVGLSSLSMSTAEEILGALNQDRFELRSAGYLDSNREEMQRLLNRFGQGDVPSRGMFSILELGKAERKALEKAHIIWQPGNTWGEDDSWARLSLGQTRETTRAAIKAALR